MQFAPQQDEALKAVSQWLKGGRSQLFPLFGYAGTGKTDARPPFAENVDGEVVFAAFTGKLRRCCAPRGPRTPKTIHSLIYRPRGEAEVEDDGDPARPRIAPMSRSNAQSPVAKSGADHRRRMLDGGRGARQGSDEFRHADPRSPAIPDNCRGFRRRDTSPITNRIFF